jgi:hypothetical protein
VAIQRILRGVSAVISFTNVDQNGTAVAAAGAVTVGVTRTDGTVLVAAGTATAPGGTGIHQLTLTAANTALLDTLTATWTDAGDASAHTTTVEICSGFYFSIAELRAFDDRITLAKYPDADVLAMRFEVETDIEAICNRSFVRRFRRETVDGLGTSSVMVIEGLRLRSLRGATTIDLAGQQTTFNAGQASETRITEFGELVRPMGIWPMGTRNVILDYEYGEDQVDIAVRRAALELARTRLVDENGPNHDRTSETSSGEAGKSKLAGPDRFSTGLPKVDAVLGRLSWRIPGLA